MDAVRFSLWLPGLNPKKQVPSMIIQTPQAMEFVLQAFYREARRVQIPLEFHVIAQQSGKVIGSGKYHVSALGELSIVNEDALSMKSMWKGANGV
jgi:hypothetical protein